MGWGRLIAAAAMCAVLAGCGTIVNAQETTTPDTTPHGSAPLTIRPGYVEQEGALKAFEQAFRARFMEGDHQGYMEETSVRFRTPCHLVGPRTLGCEAWGMDRFNHCVLDSANVSGTGVVSTMETEIDASNQANYAVCTEGSKEGRPYGDLKPED
jgi:hypothetical protein